MFMTRRSIPLLLAVACSATAAAQIQMNYQLDPPSSTGALAPLDLGGGTTLYMCERKFGWDSTHVSLLTTAADHTLIDASAFRGNSPITFLFDAVPLSAGYALCGSQTSAGLTYAFITRLTGGGTVVDWSRSIDGIGGAGFFQDQVAAIVPSGTSFTAYTKRSGILAAGSYRIFGDEGGATWNGQAMTAPAGVLYNVYGAIPTGVDEHTVFGAGALAASSQDRCLMVMRTALTGATWMNFYDMLPSTNAQSEETFSLIPTSDGNYLLTAYFTTGATTFEGALLKLAPDGGLIWCRRYADASGGLTVNAVVELPGGGLLAAGTDAAYQIMLLDLLADGSLSNARRYQAPTPAADLIQGFFTNGMGELKLIAADKVINFTSGGGSCDFYDVTTVTSTPHSPVVTTHLMGNAPFIPSTTVLNAPSRSNDLSWTSTCVLSSMQEQAGTVGPWAHPVPADDLVQVAVLTPHDRIVVYDMAGTVRFDGAYGDGLDVRRWPAGVYVIEVPRSGWRLKVIRE